MEYNKLSFMPAFGFNNWKDKEILNALSGLGYKGISWTLLHFNPRERTKKELRDLVQNTKDCGMEIAEIVVQQDLVSLDNDIRADRICFVNECIIAAADCGIDTINLFTGPAPWIPTSPKIPRDITEGKAWEMVIDAYEKFINLAEKYKIYLAVEAVWGHLCHDYYTLRELFSKVDSKYLMVNFDPSHYQLYGNDVPWAVKQWGNKIKHVHIKDVVGRPGQDGETFIFPLIGEGKVNWRDFFRALKDIGYTGYLTVEFESWLYYSNILKNDPVKAAAISIEQLQQLLKDS